MKLNRKWIWGCIGGFIIIFVCLSLTVALAAVGFYMLGIGPEIMALITPPFESMNTPQPTDTPLPPTDIPQPTDTALLPTNTPQPTDTPLPPTDTPQPTSTPLPPTDTPQPTDTPLPPTDTPQPTDTPLPPTDTSQPPDTPLPPTDTPQPTATSQPTDTPEPFLPIGSKAVISPHQHGLTGTAVLFKPRTITLVNFNFDGLVPAVEIRLGHKGFPKEPVAILGYLKQRPYRNESFELEIPPDLPPGGADAIFFYCLELDTLLGWGAFE